MIPWNDSLDSGYQLPRSWLGRLMGRRCVRSTLFFVLAALGALLALPFGDGRCQGQAPVREQLPAREVAGQVAPRHVVLLLRNLNVLEGELFVEGDMYRLAVPNGEVYVSRRDVLALADSIQDLYQQQRSRLFGRDPEPHLELAIWCAEHGLREEAMSELEAARQIDPNHPGLSLATRRVEMALLRRANPQIALPATQGGSQQTGNTPPPNTARVNTHQPRNGTTTPRGQGVGAAVVAASSSPPNPVAQPGLPKAPDLQVLFRALPEDSGEQFMRVIQPIVNNYCATAACHGGEEVPPELRLLRIAPGRPPGRGETAQNLQTILQWIDFASPGSSPLLKAPLEPHGRLAVPIFSGADMRQYRELVDWVYTVTRRRVPPPPAETVSHPDGGVTPPDGISATPPAAGIQLDGLGSIFDPAVQPAGFEAPMPASNTGQALPDSLLEDDSGEHSMGLSTQQGLPNREPVKVLPEASLLQPSTDRLPGIRYSFDLGTASTGSGSGPGTPGVGRPQPAAKPIPMPPNQSGMQLDQPDVTAVPPGSVNRPQVQRSIE